MQVKRYNITNPKKYTSNNEEKTFWANVGTMTEFHKTDGTISRIIEMNDSNITFSVFEAEQKNNNGGGQQRQAAPAQATGGVEYPQEDINPEDIPF
jgi:hypothetical protein